MADPTVTVAVVSTVGAVAIALIGVASTQIASRKRPDGPVVKDGGNVVPLAQMLADLYQEKEELLSVLEIMQHEHADCHLIQEQLAACETKLAACLHRKKRTTK